MKQEQEKKPKALSQSKLREKDIAYKLYDRVGNDVRKKLKDPVYKALFEAKFSPEMTWENYGELWEIDHIESVIESLRKMNLTETPDDETFNLIKNKINHIDNVRPMNIKENRSEGGKTGGKVSKKNKIK
jgi:hypothetical protein